MIFQNEKQIINIIKFSPPIFIVSIMILILSILFIENNRTFNAEKRKIEIDYESKNKELIKERVRNTYDFILREQKTTERELKKTLDEALHNAHSIMQNIYKNNQDKTDKEIKKLILDALRDIRFNDGRGYFFIYDKKATNIMHPIVPEFEGVDFSKHKDANGTYIIKEMIELLKHKEKSYYEWYWFKPSNLHKDSKKIGLIQNFKPYNWFIGTGEYLEDYEKGVQEKVLEHIRQLHFSKTGYIFVITYDSIYLSHIRKEFIGQHAVKNNDTQGIKKVISDIVNISKKGEGYYTYIQNKKPGIDVPIKKISYVKGLNNWSWVIGTGFYQDDLQNIIQKKKKEINDKFVEYIKNTISTALLITIILLLISIYFSKKLQEKFESYSKEINHHLEDNTKQQSIMFQQSKMAAMGEMIANIAHQWRQPLSTITTTATGMQIQKELNLLDDNMLDEGLNGINHSAQHLSNTIDDFRNFFSVEKSKNKFKVKETIEKALSLVSVQFHNKEIHIIKDIEEICIDTYENELIQVIVNLLNNARDELIKKEDSQPRLIFIKSYEQNNQAILEVTDNAGGIPEEIKQRVFEPYFTTKHQSQGTGIGLFMSREIINKNMNGELHVQNKTFSHEEIQQVGACFTIKLPLC